MVCLESIHYTAVNANPNDVIMHWKDFLATYGTIVLVFIIVGNYCFLYSFFLLVKYLTIIMLCLLVSVLRNC